MLPCDICGKAGHSWFDCPKRSTKPADWKPERLRKADVEVRIASRQRGKSAYVAMATEAALNAGKTVAIISPDGAIEVRGPGAAKDITPAPLDPISLFVEGTKHLLLPGAPNPALRPGPGRPKSIDDMRSYKAQKQREYRQRKAAEKEAKP